MAINDRNTKHTLCVGRDWPWACGLVWFGGGLGAWGLVVWFGLLCVGRDWPWALWCLGLGLLCVGRDWPWAWLFRLVWFGGCRAGLALGLVGGLVWFGGFGFLIELSTKKEEVE